MAYYSTDQNIKAYPRGRGVFWTGSNMPGSIGDRYLLKTHVKLYLMETELLYTLVPPFATITAGFCVAQLGLKAAYRLALNGYVEAAREAYCKTNKEVRSNAL